jgi:hypothetical protein
MGISCDEGIGDPASAHMGTGGDFSEPELMFGRSGLRTWRSPKGSRYVLRNYFSGFVV